MTLANRLQAGAVTASRLQAGAVTASSLQAAAPSVMEIPAFPPDEWFAPIGDDVEPYDVIVEMDGHVHGFPAAAWDDCHLSYPDECVTPPRSMSDYTLFKVGQLVTASGARIRTGPLTLKGGHAPVGVNRVAAQRYYDDTMSAFADVNIGDGVRGMWINGALRPDTTVADVRRAMTSGFSGDWREWQGNLELIAFSAVNTPGFRRKAAIWEDQRLVASLDGFGALCASIDMPRMDVEDEGIAVDNDAVLASAVERVAKSIGRSRSQLVEQIHARVYGGR